MQQGTLQTYYWEDRANKVLSSFKYNYPNEIDLYEICWRYGIRIKPMDKLYVDKSVDYESIKHLDTLSIRSHSGRKGINVNPITFGFIFQPLYRTYILPKKDFIHIIIFKA